MSVSKRTVLITGCSDGGLGAALAMAFHEAGLKVYATARNPLKMSKLAFLGIELLTLDVESNSSIAACVNKLSGLDILVNNAGVLSLMPFSDISIPDAKRVFDVNVWSQIAVTQAFLPHLLQSPHGGLIVNHTSVCATTNIPFVSVYSASKAAFAMFSNTLRLEIQSFGIRVVDLRTGYVQSNIFDNLQQSQKKSDKKDLLPEKSLYAPAKEAVEKALRGEEAVELGMPSDTWAREVVGDLMKTRPSGLIWSGRLAWLSRIATILPLGSLDWIVKKLTGFDVVEKAVKGK